MRAYGSDGNVGPWSATGTGTTNTPPVATSASFTGGTLGMGGSFAWHEAAPLGSGAFFSDADGDTLTYSAAAEKPALIGVSLSGDPGSAVLTANLLNQSAASKVNYTASDGYGGQVTRSANITVTAKTSREIAEGSDAGTAVGDPVTGTPYNGVALTYALSGKAKDSGLFVLDSATGQISVAENATLDYETDDTHREIEYWPSDSQTVFSKFYRGNVNYTVNGHASSIEVLIEVTDVDETKPTISTITRTQVFNAVHCPGPGRNLGCPDAAPLDRRRIQCPVSQAGEIRPGPPTAEPCRQLTLPSTCRAWRLGATYEVQVRAAWRHWRQTVRFLRELV